MNDPEERWQLKDAWLGLAMLFTGILISTYAFLAMRNEVFSLFWAPGCIVGPALFFIGGNAVVQSLRSAGGSRSDPEDPRSEHHEK